MGELLLAAVLVGLVTFTVARSLVYDFENEDNNNGPLKVPNVIVQPESGGQTRAANLFDAIRLMTGMYTTQPIGKSQVWRPKASATLGVWACRHCLGFWIAVVTNIFLIPGSLIERILVVFGAATINTLLISIEEIANGTQLQQMSWEIGSQPDYEPESANADT